MIKTQRKRVKILKVSNDAEMKKILKVPDLDIYIQFKKICY